MDSLPTDVKRFISQSDPSKHEIEFRFTERGGERFSISAETFNRVLQLANSSNYWAKHENTNDQVIIAKNIETGADVREIKSKSSSITHSEKPSKRSMICSVLDNISLSALISTF